MKISSLIVLLFAFCFLSGNAHASGPQKILVSVGEVNEPQELIWKKQICDLVYAVANKVMGKAVDVTCRNFNASNFLDTSLNQYKNEFGYHLRILKGATNEIQMDATNWSRVHETDFSTVTWKIKSDKETQVKQGQVLVKALSNFFLFVTQQEAFKAGLLFNGIFESQQIVFDEKVGLFKDRATNEAISINKAYRIFENESERKRNYLRTGIELGATFAAGMAVYYQTLASNSEDFDYSLGEGLKKKFSGEAILFDDNSKLANYGHVYAGVLYYQFARSNGFNSLESFLINFASSAVWEFLEYHELFSINDQILTPIGGYVVGEASYQISCSLLQKNTTAAKILAYAVNPGLAVTHAIDKYSAKNKFASQTECKNPRWSQISVYLGLERNQKPYKAEAANTYVAGLQAEVVKIDGYGEKGKSSQLIYDTAMVKALIEKNGGDGLGDLKVVAEVVAAAYYKKDIDVDSEGQLRGYDIVFGLGSAATWNDRGDKKKRVNEDFYGTINILGATAHANLFYKGLQISAEVGFYGDFAMVKAWSLNDLRSSKNGDLSDQLRVINKHQYYWGLGSTTLAALSVQLGRWDVGYDAQLSSAEDIKDRNRGINGASLNPSDFKDSYVSHRFHIMFKLTKNLRLQLIHEINKRTGSFNGIKSKSGTEHRTLGTLVYLF